MSKVARGSGDDQSPERKPTTEPTSAEGLEVDVDIRVKGKRRITRAEVVAVIAALAALVSWAVTCSP